MENHLIFVSICPQCRAEILLHEPSLEQIFQRQVRSSKDGWRINLVCEKCGLVYEDKTNDLDVSYSDNPDPYLLPGGPTVFAAYGECDNRNCGLHAILHALRKLGATETDIEEEIQEWTYGGIVCQGGHLLKTPPKIATQKNGKRVHKIDFK